MQVVLATDSVAQRDRLRQHILAVGLECTASDCVPLDGLQLRLARDAGLVVLANGDGDILPAVRLAAERAPVLVVGTTADPQAILQMLRQGAREFIEEAQFREEFPHVLERLRKSGVVKYRQGRTIAVLGAVSGSGVTTLASNLAFALAAQNTSSTALAELGGGVPTLALNLDLQLQHPLEDVHRDWQRMDAALLRNAMACHPRGVRLLAHPPDTLFAVPVPPAPLQQLALLLRSQFDFSVLDLGHDLQTTLPAVRLADTLVLVARLDVPSLRLTRQLLWRLKEERVDPEKIHLVVNRYGQRHQLPWRQAEETLKTTVRAWIPDDPGAVNDAVNHGRPLLESAPRSTITRRIGQLAALLAEQTP